MKLRYKVILVGIIICIAIQFYRPHKNVQKEITTNDFLAFEKAPKDIANFYKKSCYDCHSNYTNYKWYDHIAPASWYVDNNIKKGVFSLNFSNWKNISPINKEIMFSAIPFNINTDRMPSKGYKIMHPEAALSDDEKMKMIKWLVHVKKRFLEEENKSDH